MYKFTQKIAIANPLYVNINKIFFSEKITACQNKIKWEEWHCFAVLQLYSMSGLIEDSWILISAPAFSLWVCHS